MWFLKAISPRDLYTKPVAQTAVFLSFWAPLVGLPTITVLMKVFELALGPLPSVYVPINYLVAMAAFVVWYFYVRYRYAHRYKYDD